MGKYYSVREGREIGIFTSWADCQKSINGYSGAQYKSFANEQDAKDYLNEGQKATKLETPDSSEVVKFYVDGSFMNERVGFGIVAVKDNVVLFKDCGRYKGKDVGLRNVTGEVYGSMRAIQLARANGFDKIEICYDYLGVEYWVNGSWKAKTELTKEYVSFMNEHMKDLKYVGFRKIKAHTGEEFNEIADNMAKLGTEF